MNPRFGSRNPRALFLTLGKSRSNIKGILRKLKEGGEGMGKSLGGEKMNNYTCGVKFQRGQKESKITEKQSEVEPQMSEDGLEKEEAEA